MRVLAVDSVEAFILDVERQTNLSSLNGILLSKHLIDRLEKIDTLCEKFRESIFLVPHAEPQQAEDPIDKLTRSLIQGLSHALKSRDLLLIIVGQIPSHERFLIKCSDPPQESDVESEAENIVRELAGYPLCANEGLLDELIYRAALGIETKRSTRLDECTKKTSHINVYTTAQGAGAHHPSPTPLCWYPLPSLLLAVSWLLAPFL